jgi:hypothetical protein
MTDDTVAIILVSLAGLLLSIVLGGELVEYTTARDVTLLRRLQIQRPKRYSGRELLAAAPIWLAFVAVLAITQAGLLLGVLLYPGRTPVERVVAGVELMLFVAWVAYLIRLRPSRDTSDKPSG